MILEIESKTIGSHDDELNKKEKAAAEEKEKSKSANE
jgi:hypothetical protein